MLRTYRPLTKSLHERHERTPDGLNDWKLQTKYGPMGVSIGRHYPRAALFCVFCRFDSPDTARPHTLCNPHSGKWNHYLNREEIEDGAMVHLVELLHGVLTLTHLPV